MRHRKSATNNRAARPVCPPGHAGTVVGAVAGAGILVLGLVVAPPQSPAPGVDAARVQLTAYPLALVPTAVQSPASVADEVRKVLIVNPLREPDVGAPAAPVVVTVWAADLVIAPTPELTAQDSAVDATAAADDPLTLLIDNIVFLITNPIMIPIVVVLLPAVVTFISVAYVISQLQIWAQGNQTFAVTEIADASVTLDEPSQVVEATDATTYTQRSGAPQEAPAQLVPEPEPTASAPELEPADIETEGTQYESPIPAPPDEPSTTVPETDENDPEALEATPEEATPEEVTPDEADPPQEPAADADEKSPHTEPSDPPKDEESEGGQETE